MLSVVILVLSVKAAFSQLRPDYSDLPGKYCEKRSVKLRCCEDRMDDCGVSIRGTVCYCDQFCDRGLSGDCCPDYFALCLNETHTDVRKDCVHDGRTLTYGETVMDNCNPCTCSGPASRPEVVCATQPCLVNPALIARVNGNPGSRGWTATNHSRFWGRTLQSGLQQLLGTDHPASLTARTFPVVKALHGLQLPESFDARLRPSWAGLVGGVPDQGWCGASWAVATASTASDRFSVQAGGRVEFSAQHLLDCLPAAAASRGCRGGQLDRAWNYLRWNGVMSGECHQYLSGQTGRPGHCPADSGAESPRAVCRDLYRMQPSYRIASREMDIRHEIYTSGPVQAILRVEPDLFLYKSGVYRTSVRGQVRSAYHSVRILGWGEEVTEAGDTVPYWLVANSWGEGWGESGLFRIRRGTNEADIEAFVVGAWARTHRQKSTNQSAIPDEEQTEHQATPDQQQTDLPPTPDEQQTDRPATPDEQQTDRPATPDEQQTDRPTTPDEQQTDRPATPDEQQTDRLTTPDEQQTDRPTTPDEQQTDRPTTPDEQQTDRPSTPDEKQKGLFDRFFEKFSVLG